MGVVVHLAVLFFAGLLAFRLRFGSFELDASYLLALVVGLLIASVVLPATGALRQELSRHPASVLRRLGAGWIVVILCLVALGAAFKVSAEYSRIWFGYWVLLGIAGLAASEGLFFLWGARSGRLRGTVRNLVLVGCGDLLERVRDGLSGVDGGGFRLVGTIDAGAQEEPRTALAGLPRFIDETGAEDVWIALPLNRSDLLEHALDVISECVVDVHVIPDFEHYRLLNQGVSEWAGMPVISLSSTPLAGPERVLKIAMDRVGSALLLILLSPLLILLAFLVKATSRGPVFFHQQRHGFGGEVIDVLKFRTMRLHKEPEGKVIQARVGDARVTPIGHLLRKTSLDELPQLFNVLKGQMSLVGPRPHATEHNDLFKRRIPRYMLRHRVKPGMTGWAQVNGLRGLTETDEKMALRIEHDLWYIQNWSLWLDITILMRTPFVMAHKNAI